MKKKACENKAKKEEKLIEIAQNWLVDEEFDEYDKADYEDIKSIEERYRVDMEDNCEF